MGELLTHGVWCYSKVCSRSTWATTVRGSSTARSRTDRSGGRPPSGELFSRPRCVSVVRADRGSIGTSGPRRYEFDAGRGEWRNTRDGTELVQLLRQEIAETTGIEIYD